MLGNDSLCMAQRCLFSILGIDEENYSLMGLPDAGIISVLAIEQDFG